MTDTRALVDRALTAATDTRLLALDAASRPHEIGVTPTRLRSDLLAARRIRRRYTVLDLAAEVGLLERCVDEVVDALGRVDRPDVHDREGRPRRSRPEPPR